MNIEVVIIDDDKILRKILTRIIQICDIAEKPLQFENGADALDFFVKENDKFKRRIIFLDINMPKMDGWEFIEKMDKHQLLHNQELFLLTSSIDKLDHVRAEQNPLIKEILIKPLTIDKLKSLSFLVH
ncbi:response regulator [Christiangramia echinicola]|uniref:Response regulator receiver domain-containing protein n=1 Tax=Christiangramia echinicola TaxID=279359 RepID=A0A1H1SGC3_9FLAO|nr:response regulator [Christiangramia echinicola]SDR65005.1 Response regulator receiver domain-containing protein [Christiangramia echinicola]SDS46848.1 Response regulator receiver domain-containing protein [Christiangramia echinicola]